MKTKTLKMIENGLDNLRDEVAAEIEEDRDEKKEVLRMFERISLTTKRSS